MKGGEAGQDRRRGWRSWQSSHRQQWGLLTIQEYCLKSICHHGAVEPVITMWYSPFHSDNLFSAFPVHLTTQSYKGHSPLSISVCQSVCLFLSLSPSLISCLCRVIQSSYQGDLHKNNQLMTPKRYNAAKTSLHVSSLSLQILLFVTVNRSKCLKTD